MSKQFITPELPYGYNALEPYIDEATMRVHHDKHHATYTTNLNKALEKYPDFFDKTIEDILSNLNLIPEDIRLTVKNHGGGHLHHNILWQIMGPADENTHPKDELLATINKHFGSLDKFKEEFNNAASTVFGSGWAWLSLNDNKLIIEKTANQDSPYSLGHTPLLGIDVWEHAYYLKYQNRRAEYIQNFWSVINWSVVAKKFMAAKK
ncbi:MAG: superoxide dismutase [Patescibacteria group bacterium]